MSEAQGAKLEELWASKNDILGLEAQIVEKNEEITKGQDYTIKLKTKLADATSKVMVMES